MEDEKENFSEYEGIQGEILGEESVWEKIKEVYGFKGWSGGQGNKMEIGNTSIVNEGKLIMCGPHEK